MQINPDILVSCVDKISEEIQQKQVPVSARGNYLLRSLKESHQVSI